jgi:hypothetical protein
MKRVKLTKARAPEPTPRLTLFGAPPLIEGEDAATYDELLARIRAAVKPVDVIDEMFIADVVSLEWEVLRLRRLKTSLIRARGLEALERFLRQALAYDLYSEHFAAYLAEILQDNVPEGVISAQTLAHQCIRNEPDAVNKVNRILAHIDLDLNKVLIIAFADKAKEFVRQYAWRKPDAITLVHKLLARANSSMDALVADALAKNLDDIERIDRLTTIAESRRNIGLREIDRRRAILGEALRRSVQTVVDGEFDVIETPRAQEKNAA